MRDCGGCDGGGRHWRWCPEIVGPAASRWGVLSDHLEDVGDQIGGNDPAAANHAYGAAGLLLKRARRAADEFAMRPRRPI